MTTKERLRAKRHARRMALESLGRENSLRSLARITGRAPSTVSHYRTDRPHPDLEASFDLLLGLTDAEDASAYAYEMQVREAVEVRQLLRTPTDTLLGRGLYLMDAENQRDADEDGASMLGDEEHAESLRSHAGAALELAAIMDELRYRGISLHDHYRARGRAA